MTPIRRTLLKAIENLKLDLEDPDIAIGISEAERPAFLNLVIALKSVAQGVSFPEIEAQTHLVRQQISYRIKRLEVMAVDGKPLGLRALLDDAQKARTYTTDVLNQGKPVAGALQGLLKKYPDIHTALRALVLHGTHPDFEKPLDTGLIPTDLVHTLMLSLCEAKGIKAPSYPFCGDLQGKRSVKEWIEKVKAEHALEAYRAAKQRRPAETALRRSIRRAYACVQADAHSVPVKWTLRMPSLRGEGFIDILVTRLWIITLFECGGGAILGQSFAFSSNYSGSDLMRAVRRALVPWRRLAGYEQFYKPKDGMPSGDPDLQWRAWDVLQMDSAMAHTCSIANTTLERTVNCVVEVGPIDNPDVRAYQEGYYALLAPLIELLPGFEPKPHHRNADPPPREGTKVMHFDLLIVALELLAARYNGSRCPLTSMTHLEVLKHAVNRSTAIPRKVPENLREFCLAYDTFDTGTLGQDKNGHPVLRWENASYDGVGLAAVANLVGEDVLIAANSMDLRKIHVWLMRDGSKLGILEVEKRYRATAHSATTRKHLKKFSHADSFFRNAISLPLALRQLVEARDHKRSADLHELARLVIEQVYSPSAPRAAADPEAGDVTHQQPPPAMQKTPDADGDRHSDFEAEMEMAIDAEAEAVLPPMAPAEPKVYVLPRRAVRT